MPFAIDERGGCIAVVDTDLRGDDQGLSPDKPFVVWFEMGEEKIAPCAHCGQPHTKCWTLKPGAFERAREVLDRVIRTGVPFVLALACVGLLLPTTPTPIDDSLPSSGLHDAGRTTNPAPVTDGWRGFLWTT